MATRIHVITDSNINYGLLYDKDSEGQVNVDPEVVVTRDYFNEIKADIQKEITDESDHRFSCSDRTCIVCCCKRHIFMVFSE